VIYQKPKHGELNFILSKGKEAIVKLLLKNLKKRDIIFISPVTSLLTPKDVAAELLMKFSPTIHHFLKNTIGVFDS